MKMFAFLLISTCLFCCTSPKPSACIGTNLPEGIISLNDTVVVDGSCGDNVKNWHWDFGDGTTATGVIAKHRYTKEGMFYIVLGASNGKKSDSASVVYSVQK
ncbi:MAG: PKD domain-containing protein [Bacteroidetes bacterium]|nr:PKD domain-containing protein [Bacteroidota bacterium]